MLEPPPITDAEFAHFQRLIHEIAGISMADAHKALLVDRLAQRLKALGLAGFGEYFRLVSDGGEPHELQTMVDLLTTNETYFFREEKHFAILAEEIAASHPPGRPFEAWSAASSSGEEAYSIAMVLAETLGIDAPWSVLGSDISTRVLAVAQSGHYPLERMRGLPSAYARRYCLQWTGQYENAFQIAPELRRHTRFMQVNLNATLPDVGQFHVIFLRNVMIYFDNPTQRQVVDRLVDKLHPGGHLIIGHSESLHGLTERLRPVRPTVYRRP